MPRTISTAELKAANREAIKAKTLIAQNGGTKCMYVDDVLNCRCAIGVALNEEEIAEIRRYKLNAARVFCLEAYGLVKFEDALVAARLQRRHDDFVATLEPWDQTKYEEFLDNL